MGAVAGASGAVGGSARVCETQAVQSGKIGAELGSRGRSSRIELGAELGALGRFDF